MANSMYKPPVMPAELRVSETGFNKLLDLWEEKVLTLFKMDFFRRGVEYASLKGYLKNRVNENLRRQIYGELVYDRIQYPPENEDDRIAGERRLKEYVERLRRLVDVSGIQIEADDIALLQNSLRSLPATEADIQAAEARIGRRLPPSYREFLAISNGWLCKENPSLWPIEKVGLLREIAPNYLEIWLEHEYLHETGEYTVTPKPLAEGEAFVTRDVDVPTVCLKEAVVIGVEESEASYLILDPTSIDERGEWRVIMTFRYEYAIVAQDFTRLMEILYRMEAQQPASWSYIITINGVTNEVRLE